MAIPAVITSEKIELIKYPRLTPTCMVRKKIKKNFQKLPAVNPITNQKRTFSYRGSHTSKGNSIICFEK